MLKIKIDGCAIPNPGTASIAVVTFKDDKLIGKYSKVVGGGTNNTGEYMACVKALQIAKKMGEKEVEIQSDSLLLVKQLTGVYHVKATGLIPLHNKVLEMIEWFDKVSFAWIPREENRIADCLAYNILKCKLKGDKNG